MNNLKNGEKLKVNIYNSGNKMQKIEIKNIRNLIIQPHSPWFSEVERKFLEGAIEGCFSDVSNDNFIVGWIDNEVVGNVYYSTPINTKEIGIMGYVITNPLHRNKGVCDILIKKAIDHFLANGGICMHLATNNKIAQDIYRKYSFQHYNGDVMRYLSPNYEWGKFDIEYYSGIGSVNIRYGNWGDCANICMLYASPHQWFIKDYPEKIYCSSDITHTRCMSILPSMMINMIERNGKLWIIENSMPHAIGAITLTYVDYIVQRHAPIIDFFIAPAYIYKATDLLKDVISMVNETNVEKLYIYLASCDKEKEAIASAVGFKLEATLPKYFLVNGKYFDLNIFIRLQN